MSETIILEGIGSAEEGATVYRKADQQPMMVTGVACSYIDKFGNRKEEVIRFIELTSKAKSKATETLAPTVIK